MDEAHRTPDPSQAQGVSVIRTPDQRLRVFVSSTLQELADERAATREAITRLHLTPVLFELGARSHPPRTLYRAYLEQSHIFVGIYWQRYGWVAPDMELSGLEDEYRLSGQKPKLIYVKTPAAEREPRLTAMLDDIKQDSAVSYKPFNSAAELGQLIENDLAVLISEQFEMAQLLVAGRSEPGNGGAARRLDNLPAPSTPLVGREHQIEEICELLARRDTRLVTLHGPGGIGKTRLAMEVGRRVCERYEDGVCFVALANVDDPKQVAPAIVLALGLRESQGTPVLDSLKLALRDKHLLLVLDNFEQVVDAAPLIADLLEASPRLSVLVTSRSVLHLRGETGYPVPPLSLPPPPSEGAPSDASQPLDQYEAVRFFIERGRAVSVRFTVTAENLKTIAHICRRLDGLPLAIELAAARINLLTPEAILARLSRVPSAAGETGSAGSPLQLLTSGARDLPARQRTLRDAIDWSYNLLTPPEQKLFVQLSVFVGGCTLDAVEAVCDAGGGDALEILSSLVDKSLVRQGISADGEPRFMMLETLREYAMERLEAGTAAADVRRRHADFYVSLAHQSRTEMRGRRQREWIAVLAREDDNLRAALRWLIDQGDAVTVAEVGWSTWLYRLVRGTINERQSLDDRGAGVSRRRPAALHAAVRRAD